MAKVLDVAKYILTLANASDEDPISNLKLQKLLYYCQGFSLAIYGEKLFNEPIEKWTHGPVCPVAYHEYKACGSDPLPIPAGFCPDTVLSAEEQELIQDVYSTYGQFAAWRLREMTHDESPWASAESGGEISIKTMKEFFKTRIN